MKSFKKIVLIALLFTGCNFIIASNEEIMDTVKLSTIEIIHRTDLYNGAFSHVSMDSGMIVRNSTLNLGDLLALSTSLQVQSNGSIGAASGIFIRGSNSYHTAVNWNGFPVGSITLGTCDLSLISSGFMQKIDVIKGAQSTLYGNGTFGGAIDLKNTPEWDNKFSIEYTGLAGSFDEFINGLNLAAGNKKIQYSAKFLKHTSTGDFPYYDYLKPGNPRINTNNNSYGAISCIQNVFIKLPAKLIFEGGLWMYRKEKELPAIMGAYKNNLAFQSDQSIKSYFKISKTFNHASINFNSAQLFDFLKYTDKDTESSKTYSVYSVIKTHQFFNDINYRYYYRNHIVADLGMALSNIVAITGNYGGTVYENRFSLFAGLKFKYTRFAGNLLFRKEFNSQFSVKPVYSLSMSYKIREEKLVARFNLGKNFRTPTLNDRYWIPGGNKDLLPEYGWNTDLAFEFSNKISDYQSLFFEFAGYSKVINNIIHWLPMEGNSMIWSPRNHKKAWIRGAEASVRYNFTFNEFRFNAGLFYNYNMSSYIETYSDQSSNIGKQLQYIPVHSGNLSYELGYKEYFIMYLFKYTGKLYTDEGNNEFYSLPGYSLSNIIAGTTFELKKTKASLILKIANILNKEYQVVTAYPMPGRSFQVSLLFGFNQY